ncbi:MAG: hypothetical protein NC906_06985 [Candidatus Omnitrophica bacterium]|nr:hypothetical protein [Candidatus Omnitrophota bacterium]MCM8817764.1 hypothetical protein [Candidatus Omnitrophota bacterium]
MKEKYFEKISPFDNIKIPISLMFHRHKVAAVNFAPEKWNKARNAEKLVKWKPER